MHFLKPRDNQYTPGGKTVWQSDKFGERKIKMVACVCVRESKRLSNGGNKLKVFVPFCE